MLFDNGRSRREQIEVQKGQLGTSHTADGGVIYADPCLLQQSMRESLHSTYTSGASKVAPKTKAVDRASAAKFGDPLIFNVECFGGVRV